MNAPTQEFSRREWFRSCGRMLGLAGLGGGAIALAHHSLTSDAANCNPFPLCQGCHVIQDCALPQAIEARQQEKDIPHE